VRLALVVALLLLAAGAAPAAAAPAVISGADPEAYVLDLTYDARGAGTLRGSERIEFVNRGPAALERVWLRLWANGPDRCRPRHIDVQIEAPAQAGAERVRCSALEVRLAAPVAPGASAAVSLAFRVRGRRANDRFGHARGVALLGNVVPVLAVDDDRGLRLPPYSAIGETFYSLSARWKATLRLPARLRAATTGAVVSERIRGARRTVQVATPQARDFALAIGRLDVSSTHAAGVRIRVFTNGGARVVRGAARDARRAVTTFSRRYGPYGSSELDAVVVPFRYGGMEYPELIFAHPSKVAVVHEIAHQWWYGLVGDDQSREPWLDESFATYAHEWLNPSVNLCSPDRPYSLVNPKWRHIPLDSPMALFERLPEPAIGDVIYAAGSCALQRLERDIGRARMTAFFRLLQGRFRFGVMRTSDVIDAIREVAPNFDVAAWKSMAHLSH
jgi:hypothetical protein